MADGTPTPPVPAGREEPQTRSVLLPLRVTVAPVKALATIPFDRHADHVYTALELHYLDRGDERGWRVLAHRHDRHVDVYDGASLTLDPTERCSVYGKGVRRHVTTLIQQAALEVDENGCAHIAITFTDLYGRRISVDVQEKAAKPSQPTRLLSTTGATADRPGSFPLFLFRTVDFVRLRRSTLDVTIDGAAVALEPFPAPVPLAGARRTYVKYATDVDLLHLFPTDEHHLRTVTVTDGVHLRGEVAYHFEGEALARIVVRGTEVTFTPPLDLHRPGKGRVEVVSRPGMGVVGGSYRAKASQGSARFTLQIDKVRVPQQGSRSHRIFVNDRSRFGRWPRRYRFAARYDLSEGTVDARWTNRRDPEPR
ncbi:hypothetical protein [Luteococcus sp. OSA5]|uniref:hypothetical protein n=1 Tax=Luteococcus sp. OSA5 TaxID=3401630 RepID=UPI003B436E6D